MSDGEIKAHWAKITDPKEALSELVSNWTFIGPDPYYRDLNDALFDMAQRCCEGD